MAKFALGIDLRTEMVKATIILNSAVGFKKSAAVLIFIQEIFRNMLLFEIKNERSYAGFLGVESQIKHNSSNRAQ